MFCFDFHRAADGTRRASDMLRKQEKEEANNVAGREDFEFSKIHDGGELEKENPLVILNDDTVKLIASYLHPVDYIRFYAVCRENQLILPTINRRSSYTKFSPWLIFVKDNDSICNLVDPMQNYKQYLIKVPELLIGAKIHYSRGGWLLMSNGTKSVFFFNPFTREIIQLPDMPMGNVLHCRLLFSSLPTSSTCVVLSIGHWIWQQNGVGDLSIYTIERGKNSWRSEKLLDMHIDMYMTWLKDPVFYNGQIYCVEDDENLGVLGRR
ncbi:F-box/kelch-repeat protein At1g57790-like [Papaver somniferum]|uniref:F-box/kelch-repeat protein At1g57790-like n=1 Tax=Papaver somniferum TaxID=3469 RepID=UPI000E7032DF|nr:F-box/kelch-repeat protein At1g57790-like [Papaver somniferum]